MKTITHLLLLLIAQLLIAQNCLIDIDFENEIPNTGLVLNNAFSYTNPTSNWRDNPSGVRFDFAQEPGNIFLAAIDQGGAGSFLSNAVDITGDLVDDNSCSELCFEIKYLQTATNGNMFVNTIYFFNPDPGPFPYVPGTLVARYTLAVPIAVGPNWTSICIPIRECTGTTLPIDPQGYWNWVNYTGAPSYNGCTDFNNLINNLGGIAFNTDIANSSGNSTPGEVWGYDNFCLREIDCPTDDPCDNLTADFTVSNNGGGTYTFTDISTSNVLNVTWNIDSDPPVTTFPANSIVHTFTTPGPHTVCLEALKIVDNICCKDDTCIVIDVVLDPCDTLNLAANFSYTQAGNTVSFTDLSTPYADVLMWDFGDSNTLIENAPSNPIHTYTGPGPYHVTLTAIVHLADSICCIDTICQMIILETADCESDIPLYVDEVSSDLVSTTFQFSISPFFVNGTLVPPVIWDFGDGNTGSGDPITHTYANPIGLTTYLACATVTWILADGSLCEETVCRNVTVGIPNIPNDTIGGGIPNIPIDTNGGEINFTPTIKIESYPNPVGDLINISISSEDRSEIRLAVFDLLGKRVLAEKIIKKEVSRITEHFDTAELESGLYLIKVHQNDQIVTSRFIKQ